MNHTSNKQQQGLAECSLLQKLTLLDRIVNLGLEGASCEGPLAAPPTFLLAAAAAAAVVPSQDSNKKESIFGASVFIFPCGYGSSGGLALPTAPNCDDCMILEKEDCCMLYACTVCHRVNWSCWACYQRRKVVESNCFVRNHCPRAKMKTIELNGEVFTASIPILLYKMGHEELYGTACRWS